jgi:AMME syndrome candidate gene 1 protein
VAVSLLVNFSSPLKNALKWRVGKHGVDMSLSYNGKHYSSTFLPEVAKEEGWDQRTTLLELLLKDDFPIDDLADADAFDKLIKLMKITTYESVKYELTYADFIKT